MLIALAPSYTAEQHEDDFKIPPLPITVCLFDALAQPHCGLSYTSQRLYCRPFSFTFRRVKHSSLFHSKCPPELWDN